MAYEIEWTEPVRFSRIVFFKSSMEVLAFEIFPIN